MGESEISLVIKDSVYLGVIGTVGTHDLDDEVLGLAVNVAVVEVLELTMFVKVLQNVDEHPAIVQVPTCKEKERCAWTYVTVKSVA